MTQYDALPLADVLRDHIRGERTARMTVATHSMSPLLNIGDIIGLQYADPVAIKPGQIITFSDPNNPKGLLTHRVVANHDDGQTNPFILARGDRILIFDRPLSEDELVGQVIWRIRDGRKLNLDRGSGAWLSEKLGTIAEIERRLISGIPFKKITLTTEGVEEMNNLVLSRRESRFARSVRAIGGACSRLLAAAVSRVGEN